MSDSEGDIQEVPNDPSLTARRDESPDDSIVYDSSVAHPVEPQTVPIIVAVGASAGGLEALEAFFRQLPTPTGMAFIVIQHLDPHHRSILGDLIQRYTDMPVQQAENDMLIQANSVYVIPPNVMLALFNGTLQLLGPTANMGIRLPIDYFFRSMARDVRERCTAIVLSGTGSDGALGLKAVKEAGGMVMVQDPLSAMYDGMPRSAIGTGMVDFILRPALMPQQLLDYWKLAPTVHRSPLTLRRQKTMSDPTQQILHMIRVQTGHDFSRYKQSTIRRRIERLMAVNQIESLVDYVRFFQNNTIGVEVLSPRQRIEHSTV